MGIYFFKAKQRQQLLVRGGRKTVEEMLRRCNEGHAPTSALFYRAELAEIGSYDDAPCSALRYVRENANY